MIVLSYLMTEVQEEFGVSDYAASAIFSLVFVVRPAQTSEWPIPPCCWDLNVGSAAFGWPRASLTQGMWIGLTCFGVLADKRGRRIVYVLSMATILLFGLLSSLSTTYAGLVVTRLIVGIGVGGVHAAVMRREQWSPCELTGAYRIGGSRCGPAGAGVAFTMFSEFLPIDKRGMYDEAGHRRPVA